MVKRHNPNLLCKLGLHKWKHYGESVVIAWKEPAKLWIVTGEGLIQKSRTVLTKKKCSTCGMGLERKLVKNPDGTLSCIGWKPLPRSAYEKDEDLQQKKARRKMIR